MENIDFEQYRVLCKQSADNINHMYEICLQEQSYNNLMQYESGLEIIDYAYAVVLGIIGAYITSSKEIQNLLDKIHQIASLKVTESDDKFEKLIKMLLGHNGDFIDTIPMADKNGEIVRKFVSRNGDASRGGPHRIFWGHDILSLKKDNPLFLMEKQFKEAAKEQGRAYIPGKGVVQAIKHLTADTFSKQGLPIPTSSWWDYTYTDKKGALKQGNRLLDLCNRIYKESKSDKIAVTGANNDVFNHLFSIHIQDIAVQKISIVLCEQYIKIRRIDDEIIQHQFKLINYSVLFWMNCIFGEIKYGIPFINWTSGMLMGSEFCLLCCTNRKEIKQLESKTRRIIDEENKLEERVMNSGKRIKLYRSPTEIFQDYDEMSKKLWK